MFKSFFKEWSPQIKKYCEENNLSFEKAKMLAKGQGKDYITLAYYDPDKEKKGLLDETPMPIALQITKTSNGLVFKQTEHTQKYLSL